MSKIELVTIANRFCEEFPKNSSQKFQAYLKKMNMTDVINKCQEISDKFSVSIAAAYFMYLYDISEPPKCKDCNIYPTRFVSFNEGFLERCPICAINYSHQQLSEVSKNKSDETRKKLSEANKLRFEKEKLAKQNYQYIELNIENISKAQLEANECAIKGYTQFPMDNLKLNKIRKEYPHLMEVVKSLVFNKKVSKPLEGLYWLVHKLSEAPHCQYRLDDKCIDKVTFINFQEGYHDACGNCAKHKPESRKKAVITYKLKTGYDNPAQNPEVMKLRGDNYEKNHGEGIRHHMQTAEGQQKVIDKVLEMTGGKYKYMVDVPEIREKGQEVLRNNKEEVQRKIELSYYERYGIDRYQSCDQFKEQLRTAILNNPNHQQRIIDAKENLKLFHIQLLETPKFLGENVPFRCTMCGYEGVINITKVEAGNTWVCPVCHPYHGNQSKGEYDVMNTIKFKIPEAVYEFSNRKILNGREIDIYYPDYHLAIEYSGCKFHSSYLCSEWSEGCGISNEDYHYSKWLECYNKGIQLLTIFDDDWIIAKYRKIAIPSLYAKFGVFEKIINISECSIHVCHDKDIIYKFLSTNALDRFNSYSDSYVIMNDNKVVAMFCYEDKGDYYDIRYCNVKSINILHGFEKLLEKFRNELPRKSIQYNVNRDWNDCPKLSDFGFTLIDNNMNLNKFYWGKTLWKRKMLQDFNESNHEMLNQDKLNYLFDCGNMIYRLD